MKTGILRFKLKEGVTEDQFEDLFARIYQNNEHLIDGMTVSEFDSEKTFNEFSKVFNEFTKANNEVLQR